MTEVDRVIDWIETNQISQPELARTLGMSYDGLYQALHVRRRLSSGFKFRFLARYGEGMARSLFEVPSPLANPTRQLHN